MTIRPQNLATTPRAWMVLLLVASLVAVPITAQGETITTGVEITAPSPGAVIQDGDPLEVRWNSSFNDATGAQVFYKTTVRDGATVVAETSDYTCRTDAIGAYSCATIIPAGTFTAEGAYTVSVGLIDNDPSSVGGTVSCKTELVAPSPSRCDSTTIFVDTTPPTVTINAPSDGTIYNTDNLVPSVVFDDGAGSGVVAQGCELDDSPVSCTAALTLSDGLHEFAATATDGAGFTTTATAKFSVDTAVPTTTLARSPAHPDAPDGWSTTEVSLTFTCFDQGSGCASTEYRVGSAAPVENTTVTLPDGVHLVEYRSSDLAGNTEDWNQVTIKVDTEAPSILAGPCASLDGTTCLDNATVITETIVSGIFATEDDASGVARAEIWLENVETGALGPRVDATTGTGALDLTTVLDEDPPNVWVGQVRVHAEVEDLVGHTDDSVSEVFSVNTAGEDAIKVLLTNSPTTFGPDGRTETLTYKAVWTGGDKVGEPVQGATVDLTGQTLTQTGVTSLTGVVSFDVSDTAAAPTFVAKVTSVAPGDTLPEADRNHGSDPLPIVWTSIELVRNSSEDTPRTNEYATLGEDYFVGLSATYTYNGEAVKGATVLVDDGVDLTTTLTDAEGLALARVVKDTPAQATFATAASLAKTGADEVTGAGPDVTISWVRVVIDVVAPDGWHNVTESVLFSASARLDYGSGTEDADGAVLGFRFDENITSEVTLDSDGAGNTTVAYGTIYDAIPTVHVVSVPELVGVNTTQFESTQFDRADDVDFGTQRWTEIELVPLGADGFVDDDFVDVGTTVPFLFEARYVHNGALVGAASVDVVFNDATFGSTSCDVATGVLSGPCALTAASVDDNGTTLVVVDSEHDITRQLNGTEAAQAVVWTNIEIISTPIDDAFVNIGDAVTQLGVAVWGHTVETEDDAADLETVPEASFQFEPAAPHESCVLDNATAMAGEVNVTVSCADVFAGTIEVSVASATDDVTTLADAFTFEATWTQLNLTLLSVSEDDGALLDHDAPVTFEASVAFTHNTTLGAPVPEDTLFLVTVTASDDEEFVCVTDGGDSCVLEVSKNSGAFDFVVTGASVRPSDNGLVEEDITSVANVPEPFSFRWTSIGFTDIVCTGSTGDIVHGAENCEAHNWTSREIVTVSIVAAAQDNMTQVLTEATVTIGGKSLITDGTDGSAERDFLRISPGSSTVWIRGQSADYDGDDVADVTWDTPVRLELTWV